MLRFYLDLPDPEIARVMGIRPGTVRSATHRALKTLDTLDLENVEGSRLSEWSPNPPHEGVLDATGRARSNACTNDNELCCTRQYQRRTMVVKAGNFHGIHQEPQDHLSTGWADRPDLRDRYRGERGQLQEQQRGIIC